MNRLEVGLCHPSASLFGGETRISIPGPKLPCVKRDVLQLRKSDDLVPAKRVPPKHIVR